MIAPSDITFPGIPARRVTGDLWNTSPMQNPIVSSWNLDISMSDVTKLLGGFQPVEMEDRWMSRAEGPNHNGCFVVYVYRSWGCQEQFRIKAQVKPLSETANNASDFKAEVVSITWESGPAHSTEQEAKNTAVLVCKGILGCELGHAA
ncbi:hypothetical protein BN1723_015857 [Verticillium longisporum]|uniref:Uncharacterized protein n=1 Tax=Verticillium longisporum TaxID=100787 RepID=A0A0G4LWD3_VERLO|nr:hypothetical protein HYQ46_005805 [Verticillium longisporum]CRK25890.1 hypothetical protein BN1708_014356 [Verticillium longisporum]CRK41155.1 hypothetical protein BN1723_015857 [Verticillium longisporum]